MLLNTELMKLTRFSRFAWFVLGYNLLVILWGAFVRASGSGAGCGSHWPLCNGEVVPRPRELATVIELTHRLTSGIALILILILLVWAFREFPRKHRVRVGAVLTFVFILTEALVGAGLVLFELVAENASVARAMFMSVHLLNTFVLLCVISLTAWWASGGGPLQLKRQGGVLWLLLAGLLGTLLIGVSGAVAALGDTLYPAASLAHGIEQDLSPTAHFLVRLRLLHPTLAVTVGLGLMIIAQFVRSGRTGETTRYLSLALPSLVALQLVVGLINVWLLAPIWIQIVHLLLADFLWICLVLLSASALSESVEEERARVQVVVAQGR
jgi:heme A synthase